LFVDKKADLSEIKEKRKGGRKWLQREMAKAFRERGLENRIHKNLPAAAYLYRTDDFKIDFSYVYRDEMKCFQAVSLIKIGRDAHMFPLRVAKIKASAPSLRKEKPVFTAVVENYFNSENEDVKKIMGSMKDEDIRISHVAEMPDIANKAAIELGVMATS
jgi:hypothetical protein